MTTLADCPLCQGSAEDVLWRNSQLRVIAVDASDHPGFTRVIWDDHVSEMTQLRPQQRHELMQAVWAVERVQRQILQPDKVNLAALGNVVPHLHWHVIPRWAMDTHFPEPIWAEPPSRTPADQQAWHERRAAIEAQLTAYRNALQTALAAL
ncbi:MAG: HIT family protein [Candidimonas sp.]|nr:HIT family protein [Candidimonas sp.]